MSTKVQIYKADVLSTFMYGSQMDLIPEDIEELENLSQLSSAVF